jgi:hypothetical protein
MKKILFAVALVALSMNSVFACDAGKTSCDCCNCCVVECKPTLRERVADVRAERAEARAERLACRAAKAEARKCCETKLVVVQTVKVASPCCK